MLQEPLDATAPLKQANGEAARQQGAGEPGEVSVSLQQGQAEAAFDGDAFEELVRMAVAVDPSLAPKQPPVTAASSLLGPPMGTLPNQSKPPWLRQRAPQGNRYEVSSLARRCT